MRDLELDRKRSSKYTTNNTEKYLKNGGRGDLIGYDNVQKNYKYDNFGFRDAGKYQGKVWGENYKISEDNVTVMTNKSFFSTNPGEVIKAVKSSESMRNDGRGKKTLFNTENGKSNYFDNNRLKQIYLYMGRYPKKYYLYFQHGGEGVLILYYNDNQIFALAPIVEGD